MALTPEEVRKVEAQIDSELIDVIRPFVIKYALLPPDKFREVATARFVAYAAHLTEKARDRGGIDELDKEFFKSWWRCVEGLYVEINTSGGMSVN